MEAQELPFSGPGTGRPNALLTWRVSFEDGEGKKKSLAKIIANFTDFDSSVVGACEE